MSPPREPLGRRVLRRIVEVTPIASLLVLAVLVVVALTRSHDEPGMVDESLAGEPFPSPELGLGTATLTGRVVDSAGRAIADAGVVLVLDARPVFTWTDQAGEFQLDELPEGDLSLAVVARGFEPMRVHASAASSPVVVALSKRIDPPPDLPGIAALDLVGRVEFTSLEDPSLGYEVALMPLLDLDSLDAGLPRRVPVAPDGTFRVEALARGEYEVFLLPPEARGELRPNLLADGQGQAPVHVQPAPGASPGDDGRDPLRIELESRAGALGGRLVDRRIPGGGAWLEGALVRVEPIDANGKVDPTAVVWTRSDAEGAWRVPHLQPGRYRATLAAGLERRERDVIVRERTIVDPDL